ncbi:GGDEF domain-containing protein [Pseudoalteromonas sp. T1lg23B]|uniref:GGDEF domain-containing protein n=1 Tax=Pseudoalteromonas sp. T1lg23B TaxID=2077097 RepID=UPI000CF67AF3|nr:GGDEF domain-containing protein [Pseudoalteromonas sp. T1lg23B]
MEKISSCGYEWTIGLISQNSEHTLDSCLAKILTQLLGESCVYAFYFSKSLSVRQTPCLTFASTGELHEQYKMAVEEIDVPPLLERLKKLNQDVQLLSLAQLQILPVRYQGLVLGFLAVHDQSIIPSSGHTVLNHVLNVYVHQLATLQYARVDPLTQLLNRQTFDEKIIDIVAGKEAWLVRGNEQQKNWYMAIADIDLFKHVNDNYGHVIGDEVILLVAQLLKSNFRVGDYVFRYGGEEFAIVFPCRHEGEAMQKLDSVRALIADTRFPQVGNVTISMGFVELKDAGQVAELVNRADQALYQSKQDGRNRVTAFSSLKDKGCNHSSGDIELF